MRKRTVPINLLVSAVTVAFGIFVLASPPILGPSAPLSIPSEWSIQQCSCAPNEVQRYSDIPAYTLTPGRIVQHLANFENGGTELAAPFPGEERFPQVS